MGLIGAGLAGIVAGAATVALVTGVGGGSDKGRIEQVVHSYLLQNPEVLEEVSQALHAKKTGQAVRASKSGMETAFAGAWAGAKDGDVVLVEFFDYACGYCRASNPVIARLLSEDKKLKIVWREWPVLGPDSEAAAQTSLAVAQTGKYKAFHEALFAAGRPTPAAVAQALSKAGVTPQQVAAQRGSPAVIAELRKNYELARSIGAGGTPTWVVGDKVLEGAVGYDALKAAIQEARARG
jgi:protein-disulfide isomerase